jgi:Cu+-exporting ATPase
MTVNVATARHKAEVKGTAYYFCCAGCRAKFLEKGVNA